MKDKVLATSQKKHPFFLASFGGNPAPPKKLFFTVFAVAIRGWLQQEMEIRECSPFGKWYETQCTWLVPMVSFMKEKGWFMRLNWDKLVRKLSINKKLPFVFINRVLGLRKPCVFHGEWVGANEKQRCLGDFGSELLPSRTQTHLLCKWVFQLDLFIRR